MTFNAHRSLVAILALAVLLRVALALYWGDAIDAPPLLTDQRSYHALGERLLAGQGFSFAAGWYPFTPPETPTAHWSFLQSIYIAAVYGVAGPHPLAARLATAVLGGILLPLTVYALAHRWQAQRSDVLTISNQQLTIDNSLSLTAAFLAAIYPYFILYAATLMTETLYIVALLWSLERALALREALLTQRRGGAEERRGREGERERGRGGEGRREEEGRGGGEFAPLRQDGWLLPALTLGLAWGIAALMRQAILPWVAVAALWLLGTALWDGAGDRRRRFGRAVAAVATAGGVLVLCILPFTLRNYAVYGQFLLLNSNTGYAMYSAQHPLHGTDFQEFAAAPLPAELAGQPLNEAQWDRVLMARGIQFVLDDPVRYALLSLSRVPDYFEFWPTPDTTLLHNVGRVLSFGWLLPLSVVGIAVALRGELRGARGGGRRRRGEGRGARGESLTSPTALLLLFVATYSVLHILTWAMPRYRLPVDAVLVIFAAGAVVWGVRWMRGMTRRNGKVEPAL